MVKLMVTITFYLCCYNNIYSQELFASKDNVVSLMMIKNKNGYDFSFIYNKTNTSYNEKEAFFSYNNKYIIQEVDLDGDSINEYLVCGETGGNGITVRVCLFDLKISISPVLTWGLSVNPDKYNATIEKNNTKLLITENTSSGASGRNFFYCLKYSNGEIKFDLNLNGNEYKKLYSTYISKMKAELKKYVPQRNKHVINYVDEDLLEAYLLQNLIVNDNYNIEQEADKYIFREGYNAKSFTTRIYQRFYDIINY